ADRKSAEPTFMNYPWRYTGAGTGSDPVTNYWEAFQFASANRETFHMCHDSMRDVIMGGNPYIGETTPAMNERIWTAARPKGLRLQLRVRRKRRRNIFEFGEPIHVELKRLTTSRKDEIPIHETACPDTGVTEFVIRKPNGTVVAFEPLHRICMERNE